MKNIQNNLVRLFKPIQISLTGLWKLLEFYQSSLEVLFSSRFFVTPEKSYSKLTPGATSASASNSSLVAGFLKHK